MYVFGFYDGSNRMSGKAIWRELAQRVNYYQLDGFRLVSFSFAA